MDLLLEIENVIEKRNGNTDKNVRKQALDTRKRKLKNLSKESLQKYEIQGKDQAISAFKRVGKKFYKNKVDKLS